MFQHVFLAAVLKTEAVADNSQKCCLLHMFMTTPFHLALSSSPGSSSNRPGKGTSLRAPLEMSPLRKQPCGAATGDGLLPHRSIPPSLQGTWSSCIQRPPLLSPLCCTCSIQGLAIFPCSCMAAAVVSPPPAGNNNQHRERPLQFSFSLLAAS